MKSRAGSRQRYGLNDDDDLVPQGIEGMVPFSGTVSKVMKQYCGGLQASLGYCGSKDITGLKKAWKIYSVSGGCNRSARSRYKDHERSTELPSLRRTVHACSASSDKPHRWCVKL